MWWEPFLNIVSSLGISYSFTMKGNGLYHPEPTAQASHVRYLGSKECSSKVEAAFGSGKICRRKSSSKQQVGRPGPGLGRQPGPDHRVGRREGAGA